MIATDTGACGPRLVTPVLSSAEPEDATVPEGFGGQRAT